MFSGSTCKLTSEKQLELAGSIECQIFHLKWSELKSRRIRASREFKLQMYPSSRYQGPTVLKKKWQIMHGSAGHTNKCHHVLYSSSRSFMWSATKKKGQERKKKPPTSIQCLFKFTYVIHAYIYSITFLKQPSTL